MAPVILLPGILMPATLRYEKLIAAIGDQARTHTKELEVYSHGEVRHAGYSLATELDGIDRFADSIGAQRFHLYGHSGGGACALAYTARSPERVLSLAMDEAASDFSPAVAAELESAFLPMKELSDDEMMGDFASAQVRPGVAIAPPPGPPPPWMATRPAGIRAFIRALAEADVDLDALRAFPRPVLYSYGSLSSERWEEMASRLQELFQDITIERFEGAHHMQTSHMIDLERVATSLRAMWDRVQGG